METNRYIEIQGRYQWAGEFSMEWFNKRLAIAQNELCKIIDTTYKNNENDNNDTIKNNENDNKDTIKNKDILTTINTGNSDRLITYNHINYHVCCIAWLFE